MSRDESSPGFPWIGLSISVALLAGLVFYVLTHLGEARSFASLVEQARPQGLFLALGLQLATYVCAGGIWQTVAAAAGQRLRLLQLARLAIEKLSVDQFMPGAGNFVVVRAMRRLGMPAPVAAEAVIIDILAYHAAYAVATVIALFVLWGHHEVTRVILSLVAVFFVLLVGVPAVILWLVEHRHWKPGPRLARIRWLGHVLEAVDGVSRERIRDPRLLGLAAVLNFAIFLLDAGTLWAVLEAMSSPVPMSTAFAALVVASIAKTISLLPGGIGSFEAGCTLALTLMGVPVEAALTGTLLLRGLTLWLPLIPGGLLARRDVTGVSAASPAAEPPALS